MAEVKQTQAQQAMWSAYMFFEGSSKPGKKTALDPDLSAKDIHTMAKSMQKASVQNGEEGKAINENFKDMLALLRDKNSDGGATVTAKEAKELYEYMLNVTGRPYKYSETND